MRAPPESLNATTGTPLFIANFITSTIFELPAGRRLAVTARPYYLDLRERVESGETVRAVEPCSELCVSGRAAAPRRAKWADTGALFLAKERDWVLARIEESPTITLRGLQAELAERGVAISYGAVWASSMATARVSKKTV